MKMNRLFLPLLTLGMIGLSSCSKPVSTASSSQAPTDSSSSSLESSSSLDSSSSINSSLSSTNTSTSYEEIDITPISEGGTPNGRLVDIRVNAFCRNDFEYDCSFKTDLADKSLTFKTSDPNVITVKEEKTTDENFTLVTHNPGNAVLTVYNANDMIVFRNVVRVRPAIAPEDMEEYLFNVDSFQSIYNTTMMANYELTFTSVSDGENPATAYFAGSDEVDQGAQYTFSYTYSEYIEANDFYQYSITMISSNVATELLCFNISSTGDMLMIYYDSGDGQGSLLTMLVPDTLLYLHSEQ